MQLVNFVYGENLPVSHKFPTIARRLQDCNSFRFTRCCGPQQFSKRFPRLSYFRASRLRMIEERFQREPFPIQLIRVYSRKNVNSRFHVNRSQIFFKQTRIRISSIHRSCAISHNLSAVSSSHPEQSWISNNNFLIFSVVFVCFFISLSLFLLQIVRDLALARYVLLRKIYRSSLPKSPYSTANPIVESSASQRRAIWTLRRFLFARAVIVVCADMRLVISQFI